MEVWVAETLKEGSCNSCKDKSGEFVYIVRLRTMLFRLCEDCKNELLDKLKRV